MPLTGCYRMKPLTFGSGAFSASVPSSVSATTCRSSTEPPPSRIPSHPWLVLRTRDTPFPFETVRDLLGIVRALYVLWREQGRPTAELEHIGKELRSAIALARRSPVPSTGHGAAWNRAGESHRAPRGSSFPISDVKTVGS